MEIKKTSSLHTVAYCGLIGLSVACFSQSCGTMRGAPLPDIKNVYLPIDRPNAGNNYLRKGDTPKVIPAVYKTTEINNNTTNNSNNRKADSILSNQNLMLVNQGKSLDNEGKMLTILNAKDKELNGLKHKNEQLKEKVGVSKEIKNDAVIQDTVWKVGGIALVIISLYFAILITVILVRTKKHKLK